MVSVERCVTFAISMYVDPSPDGTKADGDGKWGAMKPAGVVGSLEPAADSPRLAVGPEARRRPTDHVGTECHSATQRRLVPQRHDGWDHP